jgi:hypothetical protein
MIDEKTRVSDPYSFDPDPAFEAGDKSGSGSGSRALMAKNCKKKITAEIFFFLYQKQQFTYRIPRPP